MRRLFSSLCLAALIAVPAAAQQGRLDLSPLNVQALEKRATHFSQVTLDGNTLRMALANMKNAPSGMSPYMQHLQGVYIYSFKFSGPGQYPESAIKSIESQLSGHGWNIIVRDQGKAETSIIAMHSGGEEVSAQITVPPGQRADGRPIRHTSGFAGANAVAIIDAKPDQLDIVNVIGPISDLASLGQLGALGALGSRPRPTGPPKSNPKP